MNILPGQHCVLQSSEKLLDPGQVPPSGQSESSQSLNLRLDPPSHDAEHAPHSPQLPQLGGSSNGKVIMICRIESFMDFIETATCVRHRVLHRN